MIGTLDISDKKMSPIAIRSHIFFGPRMKMKKSFSIKVVFSFRLENIDERLDLNKQVLAAAFR